jgi:hypothetical protein
MNFGWLEFTSITMKCGYWHFIPWFLGYGDLRSYRERYTNERARGMDGGAAVF